MTSSEQANNQKPTNVYADNELSETLRDVNQLLQRWSSGSETAWDNLLPIIYQELHRLAERACSKNWINHTLNPTVLVNELYLTFKGRNTVHWQDKEHFFAVSAKMFRQILVDYARYKNADKRNGHHALLVRTIDPRQDTETEILALDQGMKQLEKINPDIVDIMELRYFGGLTVQEIAKVLNLNDRTVFRRWTTGKTWLKKHLSQ